MMVKVLMLFSMWGLLANPMARVPFCIIRIDPEGHFSVTMERKLS